VIPAPAPSDVVFVGDARPPALTPEHEGRLGEGGLRVVRVGEAAAAALLDPWLASDRPPPAVVVFGISLRNPLALARSVHRLAPAVHLVFVIVPERAEEFRVALARAPLIGNHWDVVEEGDVSLVPVVREAGRATGRRLAHQAAVQRLNDQLRSGPAAPADARRLIVTNHYLASILEYAEDAILAVEHDDRIASWNRGAAQLFGVEGAEVLGRSVGRLAADGYAEAFLALVASARGGTAVRNLEMTCRRADGTPFHAEVTIAPVRDDVGAVDSVSVVARDVTERRRYQAEVEALNAELRWRVHDLNRANAELERTLEQLERTKLELIGLNEALERQATTDALTGLKNRIVFQNSLVEMIAVAERHGDPLSVLLVDVDHFKRVNDTWGHQEGDRVLREVARALAGRVRDQDIVARFGGEEFAVLLPHADLAAAVALAEQLRSGCRHAVQLEPPLTVSIGVASYVYGDSDVQLIGRADAALYGSKANGRDRVTAAPAGATSGSPPGAASGAGPTRT